MSQVIDLAAGLRARSIEGIPQVRRPREDKLYCTIEDREVEIFATGDQWHWRTIDPLDMHHPLFMHSKPHVFDSAAGAQQDAVNRIAGVAA